MSALISNLFHRASLCPFACFFKLLLLVGFIYALHIAAYHQTDVSPYLFTLLVDAVGVVAVLTLAFHWNCHFRKV
jgi:hypothetical protein